jgi:putative flavoprotein involved in K+ transport
VHTTVVIIGAGQAGLATSRSLTDLGIDHVLLERGVVANAWRTQRWDSLRLLTPNWMSRLPGWTYEGDDPDGYMSAAALAEHLDAYGTSFDAPVRTGTEVTSVRVTGDGFTVHTDDGPWTCRAVVIATGAASTVKVPAIAHALPSRIQQVTSLQYRNPGQLGDGTTLVVGASASGAQIADEIRRSGRDVVVAAGEHTRVPRTYRGMDIHWWMDAIGLLDESYDDTPDIDRARRLPSLQLVGSDDQRNLDIATLAASGVEVVGRLVGVDGDAGQFAGSLANAISSADLKMGRLLDRIDEYATKSGLDKEIGTADRPDPTPAIRSATRRSLDDIDTIVWATGLRADHRWLDSSLVDRHGVALHDGGVGHVPGLYTMGLPFMRRRKSVFIDGAGADAPVIAARVAARVGALSDTL